MITTFHMIILIILWILGISLLHMHIWFLYSCHMDLVLITCITIPCYWIHVICLFPLLILLIPLLDTCSRYWYRYSRYWTWELLICYMWTSTSIVPVSRYIVHVILFMWYCSSFRVYCSRYIVLCYQQSSGPVIVLPVLGTVFILVTLYTWYIRTYQIIKLIGVWGRLDGWLDLIGWCTGSILFSHCRGR